MTNREIYNLIIKILERDNQAATTMQIRHVAHWLITWHDAVVSVQIQGSVIRDRGTLKLEQNKKLTVIEKAQRALGLKSVANVDTAAAVAELERLADEMGQEAGDATEDMDDLEQEVREWESGNAVPAADLRGATGHPPRQDPPAVVRGPAMDGGLESAAPPKGRRPRRSKIPPHLRLRTDAGRTDADL